MSSRLYLACEILPPQNLCFFYFLNLISIYLINYLFFYKTVFQVFSKRSKIQVDFFSGAFFSLHKSKPVLLVKTQIMQALGEFIWRASNSSFKSALNSFNITCDH